MSGLILAIDAGNTRIKWGIHDGKAWRLCDATSHQDFANGIAVGFANGPALRGLPDPSEIDRIVISNVAGPAIGKLIEEAMRPFGKPCSFITARSHQCGVTNGYDSPAQLGSDRWAALIGAHRAALGPPRATLVVMCGTALTVDALAADGQFLGGIIVPGLLLMHRALNQGTAQLPAVCGEYQQFPTSTANAISSGAIAACAGAVARMYANLSVKAGHQPHCVGSGGAMVELAQHLSFPLSINDNLVLDGLLAIAHNTICATPDKSQPF